MTAEVAYVGSYATAAEPGIQAFAVDRTIAPLTGIGGVEAPSFLALDPDRRLLIAVSETGVATHGDPGRVHAFRLHDGDVPVLEPLSERPSMGDHPCHIRVHPGGRWVVVCNYGSGTVAVLPLGADGLGEAVTVLRHVGTGPHPRRQESAHPHAALFSDDGEVLLVADLGMDRVVVYDFDAETGSARERERVATVPGGGPRHMTFIDGGARLAVVNELTSSLTVFHHVDGRFEPAGTTPTVPEGVSDNLAADVHAVGRHLYVSNRGHDSIAVFDLDDGRPRRVAVRDAGGRTPRGFAPTPEGDHLLVAAQDDDRLVLLPLGDDGDVGSPEAVAPARRPTCVVFDRPRTVRRP